MPATAQLKRLPQSDPTQGQEDFMAQAALIPNVANLLQDAANRDNSGFQTGVFGVDPNLQSNIGSVDEMARQYGLGAVDKETRNALQRGTAYNAIAGGYMAPLADATGGYGVGSSMANASQAVAVGKEAANRQQMAPQLSAQAAQASLALNPTHINVGSTLISPASLQAQRDAADLYNNELENQFAILNSGAAAQADASANKSLFSGIGGGLSALGGGGGGGGAGGGLMSMFGGGGYG